MYSRSTYFPQTRFGALAVVVAIVCVQACVPAFGQRGKTELEIIEADSAEPLTVRLKLLNSKGKPQRVPKAAYQNGWSLVEDFMSYRGREDSYTYKVAHGPQFSRASGGFTLQDRTASQDTVQLPRHCDLASEGWYGGDLMSLLSATKTHPWLTADDLNMAVSVSKKPFEISETTSQTGAWVEGNSYHDARPGSGLSLHHWSPPAAVPAHLPSARLLVMAKSQTPATGPCVIAEIQNIGARDVPVWLASGKVDLIQVLSNQLTPEGIPKSAFKPFLNPEPGRFTGQRGPGRMAEYLYWQVLDAGIRIAPSAGTGFGRGDTTLGYNRVYCRTGSPTDGSWWQALAAGRSFITNGPLLRATVNDCDPGEVFQVPAGQSLGINVALTLTVADPVDYVDVIYNGQAIYHAALDEFARQGGKIPKLSLEQSGWLVVRVVTRVQETYRLASTAPFYIEVGTQPRITRSSVELFTRWLDLAEQDIQKIGGKTASSAAPFIRAAREFWSNRMEEITIE